MNKDNREITVLKEMSNLQKPIGAIYLSQKLEIPQGSLGRILNNLEYSGLLKKEQNKGRVITPKGEQYLEDSERRLNQLHSVETLINTPEEFSKKRLLEIVDMRITLECKTLESACQNITDAQIQEIEEIIIDNTYEVKKGLLGEATDLQLHLTLAKYSGNTTAYQIINLLLTQSHSFSRLADTRGTETDKLILQHEKILQSLKERDTISACEAMKVHLQQQITEIHLAYPD